MPTPSSTSCVSSAGSGGGVGAVWHLVRFARRRPPPPSAPKSPSLPLPIPKRSPAAPPRRRTPARCSIRRSLAGRGSVPEARLATASVGRCRDPHDAGRGPVPGPGRNRGTAGLGLIQVAVAARPGPSPRCSQAPKRCTKGMTHPPKVLSATHPTKCALGHTPHQVCSGTCRYRALGNAPPSGSRERPVGCALENHPPSVLSGTPRQVCFRERPAKCAIRNAPPGVLSENSPPPSVLSGTPVKCGFGNAATHPPL